MQLIYIKFIIIILLNSLLIIHLPTGAAQLFLSKLIPLYTNTLFVLQGGIFKLIHEARGNGSTVKRNAVYKAGFKAFTMIPFREDKAVPNDIVMAYADYLASLTGFETSLVYRLHNSSGLAKEGLYEWIIETSLNSTNASEESVLRDLMNCPMVNKEWEISIFKDYIQMDG